jgi:hypothetical protein
MYLIVYANDVTLHANEAAGLVCVGIADLKIIDGVNVAHVSPLTDM